MHDEGDEDFVDVDEHDLDENDIIRSMIQQSWNTRHMKCTGNDGAQHTLREHTGEVNEYDGSPVCDECGQENLPRFDMYYRCNRCDYDRCNVCTLVKLQILLTDHIMIPEDNQMFEYTPNDDVQHPDKHCSFCDKSTN
jgi:hypothetical protein